jgi:hypothetical protein
MFKLEILLSRNVYIRPWPTPSGGSQLEKTPGQTVQNGPRSHQRAHPEVWSRPATFGNKLPFTEVRLALSLVQYWPGQIQLREIDVKWNHVPLSL